MKAKLYISKENLKYNVKYVRRMIGEDKDIIAMVKANAYGAGDVLISKELQNLGINNFGVANIEEAIRLRENGITGMIIVTSVCLEDEIDMAIKNDITLSVSSLSNLFEINEVAKKYNTKAKVHIKIDTGMTRLGFSCSGIINNLYKILTLDNILFEGIYTHLASADKDRKYTEEQIGLFNEVVKKLETKLKFKYIHILNSDGVQLYSDIDVKYTHVRVGLMLYGYIKQTKPILKLTAPIIHINTVDKYTKVGYNSKFIAKPGMKIAVAKLGYADGFTRRFTNTTVEVNNVKCKIAGKICMDMFMIDVTDVKDVNINDEVVIFDYTNDLKELSKDSGRIVYEVISTLGSRIERIIE